MSVVTGKEGPLGRPPLALPPPPRPGLQAEGAPPRLPALLVPEPAPGAGAGVSAFRAVGSQLAVASPAVLSSSSPLPCGQVSPEAARRPRRGSSDRESASPTPSSTGSERSQPATPVPPGPSHQGRDAFSWPSHGYDENRQLLGTEEESSEVGGSSEEEDESKNVWLITGEQYSYYVTQFRAMQPNPRGVIPGTQAKEFFEKSRLPIQELRQIWQLSDVTKDGCLSLEEFLTAMHLVVLRRNDIPLPEQLPLCLRPVNLQQGVIDRHHKDLYNGPKDLYTGPKDLYTGPKAALLADSPSLSLLGDCTDGGKVEGITDPDTALSPQSVVSSPGGPKPVKFDLTATSAAVSQDPTIACPVPFRPSPDSPCLGSSEEEEGVTMVGRREQRKKREVEYEQLWNVEDRTDLARPAGLSSSEDGDTEDDAPVGGLLSSSPSIAGQDPAGPVSLPPPAMARQTVLGLGKKEGLPPAPPARPAKSHARSSSLDLQAYRRTGQAAGLPALPSVPPRSSPWLRQESHPSLAREEGGREEARDVLGRDTREISAEIHKYKESVALLTRTLAELGQEVNDTLEERVVLEYQLDQLKAIGTGGD